MRPLSKSLLSLLLFAASAFPQNYPFILKNFAGTFPLGDGGRAEDALFYYPNAVVPDTTGNLYILDSLNYRIRKMGSDGRISTVAVIPTYGYDMKLGSDGSFYVGGDGVVLSVSSVGAVTVLAGNGRIGYAGDGGPATEARVGIVYGVAVDATGAVYFSDFSDVSNRIRQIRNGVVRTVAGAADWGFRGDNGPAADALFDTPSGIAVDAAGAVYVADYFNSRVRKFTVGGTISTVAGNGFYNYPTSGPATASAMGTPNSVFVDVLGNLIIADPTTNLIMKVTPTGALTIVAGNRQAYTPIEDGPALSVALRFPNQASADGAGSLYIVDQTHRIRRVGSDGRAVTIAGRLHFGGDNGPAAAAILNEPVDIAVDAQNNAFIVDAANYLIRRVTPTGTISTYAGKLNAGVPANGTAIGNAQLPYLRNIAIDSRGAMYIAGNLQVFKVTDGIVNLFAGNGNSGNAGDNGKATSATFTSIAGLAVDSAGKVYIADSNRVRVVNTDGTIAPFAGTGLRGRGGDGSLATSAQFDFTSRAWLAVDRDNNLYISDGNNFSVRKVDTRGIISTVVGNGQFGHADNAPAASAFSTPGALAVDSAGNLYVASQDFPEIYRLSGGVLRLMAGAGDNRPTDGAAALGTQFLTWSMKFDAAGDLYSVDRVTSTVRKLVMNSPTGLVISDGNAQTAQVGQPLPKLLKVQVNGRAGSGVSGVAINFAVKSGSATLSAATAQTDGSGVAGIAATLGSTAGPVVITATAAGTTLPVLEFTATATSAGPTCSPVPAVTSARSAGDFGGSTAFASGSWLEIKGSNLSATTRTWAGDDFNGANAPTTLDGVTVTVNGRRAFVGYISPTQINVQAPGDTAVGPLDLIVTSGGCAGEAFRVQKAAVAGGLLAPSVFNVGGTQFAAALYQDGFTFVGRDGLIPGVPFRAAAPGDIITLYGIGFGDVLPAIAPGTVVSTPNNIPGLTLFFGSTEASVSYAGLAPNAVGLYQFNLTVPNVASGDHRIVIRVNGIEMPQTAYLTVR